MMEKWSDEGLLENRSRTSQYLDLFLFGLYQENTVQIQDDGEIQSGNIQCLKEKQSDLELI